MKVFDVFLNDRKVCRAGVGDDGVLSAIVSWARLTGPAAKTARRLKSPPEETRLHVGGLAKNTHRNWTNRNLKPGDRVTVAITTARSFDPPVRTTPRDPRAEERQQRRYYEHLKEKFQGHQPGSPAGGKLTARMGTRFLNVDLDIWSASPLDSLVRAFGRTVVVLHAGSEGRRGYGAHLELARSGSAEDADRLIGSFVRLVTKLPRRARASWNRARRRDFNLGIQASANPHSYELPVEAETLAAVASVNARLVVTVYGANRSPAASV
ncbi:MAG: hypothetical protein ACM4AI_05830 [Acidobacteriota bacterium]